MLGILFLGVVIGLFVSFFFAEQFAVKNQYKAKYMFDQNLFIKKIVIIMCTGAIAGFIVGSIVYLYIAY